MSAHGPERAWDDHTGSGPNRPETPGLGSWAVKSWSQRLYIFE